MGQQYVYHDLRHVQTVVEAARLIAKSYNLSEEQLEILELAAWFHDAGFSEGAEGHEERSVEIARSFLKSKDYDEEKIKQVGAAILDTRYDAKPMELLNQILRDADLSHLGSLTYWNNCGKVRQELAITQNKIMSEQEWIDFELGFMERQEYITEVARSLFQKQKEKHIKQLKKQRMRLYPDEIELVEKKKKKKKKKKVKNKDPHFDSEAELKELKLGRGVETMYRSTYRTHINLSSIADNKANIMLSINAIIISIVVSSLVPKFLDFPMFIIPTLLLLVVCLISIVFATLSTRPKVTEGKFTESDIKGKTSNLLFFGNYYNMDLDIFHWGMMEMIKDSDFLYSSMTRDLYFLGKVLAKKYKYLSICYNIFMYGLFLVVLAFIIALIFGG
ncbi:MAG: Pycsar system effector family protein [Bacteroidota bacterium]